MPLSDIISASFVGGGIAAFLYVLARVIAVLWNELVYGRPKPFKGPRYTERLIVGDVCNLPPGLRKVRRPAESLAGEDRAKTDRLGTHNNAIARHDGSEL